MYDQAQLMQDVMTTVQNSLPAILSVALFLASVNFVFNLLFFVLEYFTKKPFRG